MMIRSPDFAASTACWMWRKRQRPSILASRARSLRWRALRPGHDFLIRRREFDLQTIRAVPVLRIAGRSPAEPSGYWVARLGVAGGERWEKSQRDQRAGEGEGGAHGRAS